MLKRILFIFFMMVCHLGLSQVKNVDSLVRVALDAPSDTNRVILLNTVSSALRESDNDLTLRYAEEARGLATQLGFKKGLSRALENIGWIYYRKGEYSKSLENSNLSLQISEELGNKSDIANCLNNIGAVNFEQGGYDLAIASFKRAYQLAKEMNDPITSSRSSNNIAFVYLKINQLDSARFYTNQSIQERFNDRSRAAFSYRMLGDISFQEGKYQEALQNYDSCLTGADKEGNNFLKTSTMYRIGTVYLKLNDPDKALKFLVQNLAIAQKFGYRSELESTYFFLSEAYVAKKDFSRAFEFQRQYYLLHDSLIDKKLGEQIFVIEAKHDAELKNAQIDLLIKNAKLQRAWIYIIIFTLFLLLLMIAVLVRSNRRARIVNALLAQKNSLINEQASQLRVLNTTKDKLFSIIGHDLRSPLNGLRGMMELLNKSFLTQEEFIEFSKKIKTNIDLVYSDLENLLGWSRSQQKGLKPYFEEVSLYEAVLEKVNLLNEQTEAKAIDVKIEVDSAMVVMADKNQLGLIIRNLLNNAIKFSRQAGQITVRAMRNNGNIEIAFVDVGTGMDPDDVHKLFKTESHFTKPGTSNEKGVGLGLLLVKEFVELNNGAVSVSSEVNKGSTFTVSFPAKN